MEYRRAGFTLIEQVVVVILLLIVGAVAAPHIVASFDRARVDQAADSLRGIVEASTHFNRDVRTGQAVTPYPGRITHLSEPIVAGDAGFLSICGNQYSGGNAAGWRGPYLNRTVPASGFSVGIGTALDELALLNVGTGQALAIEVTGVTVEDAEALSRRVDGEQPVDPHALGTVQWTPPGGDAEGQVTLFYLRPVPTC